MTETKATRPYLPELESVDSAEQSYLGLTILILIVIAAACAALTTYVYAVVKQALGLGFPGWQEWLPVSFGLFLLLAIGLSFTSWFYYKISTDTQYLTFIGLLRRKSIPWSDISKMTLVYGGSNSAYCKVTVGKNSFSVGALGPKSAILVASVWQHLNKRGIVTEDDLPAVAQSLWTPIPNTIPDELDWHNAKPIDRDTAVATAALAVFLALLGLYTVYRLGYMEKLLEHGYHVATGIVGGLMGLFHSRFQTARSLSIRTDSLAARTLLGKVDVPWSKIKSAQIAKNNLVINCGGFRDTVRIRYDIYSDSDVQLVLAIIRRLRLSPKPIPVIIPEPLASVKYLTGKADTKPVLSDDSVEMRMPVTLRILPALGMLAFVALERSFTGSQVDLMKMGMWAISTFFFVQFVYFSARFTHVDHRGITDYVLWRRRFVSWDEVALCSVETRYDRPELSVLHLKDSSRHTLISLDHGSGWRNRERFYTFVDAMLADVPREEHR